MIPLIHYKDANITPTRKVLVEKFSVNTSIEELFVSEIDGSKIIEHVYGINNILYTFLKRDSAFWINFSKDHVTHKDVKRFEFDKDFVVICRKLNNGMLDLDILYKLVKKYIDDKIKNISADGCYHSLE